MKKINAVEMVRKIRDEHFRITEKKTPKQTLKFYREEASRYYTIRKKNIHALSILK